MDASTAPTYRTELQRILNEEVPRYVTQREIAKRAGIHESQLSRIANGMHCDDGTRQAIADALERNVNQVFPT